MVSMRLTCYCCYCWHCYSSVLWVWFVQLSTLGSSCWIMISVLVVQWSKILIQEFVTIRYNLVNGVKSFLWSATGRVTSAINVWISNNSLSQTYDQLYLFYPSGQRKIHINTCWNLKYTILLATNLFSKWNYHNFFLSDIESSEYGLSSN